MLKSHFETMENMKEYVPLIPVNKKTSINSSGIPMCYDDENLYVDANFNNSLVIGESGSAKTQLITLPLMATSLIASESIILIDRNQDIYKYNCEEYEKNGYNVIKLNFDNVKDGNRWNPFSLITKLYKNQDYDLAQEAIESLGFYLIRENTDKVSDPFWENSAINYLSGIILYALENELELSFDSILKIENKIKNSFDEFINSLDKKSASYINLIGILDAPKETRGSIISVFDQKVKLFFSKLDLKNMLSDTNFDYSNLLDSKTIIYLIPGVGSISERLLSLFISQITFAKKIYNNQNKYNIILNDFYNINYIKNFTHMLNNSRMYGVKFTVIVNGFNEINKVYGIEETNIIKACFNNIIYLLSSDLDTLEEISKMCGMTDIDGKSVPLVSVADLKTMKMFEAIILAQRVMPFKTKLIPYNKMLEKGIF